MCTMRVVVLREMLGNRETGWTLWDGKQVMEMTSKQIKDTIARGFKVCGLKVGSDGELERDEEGFYCTNIMEHRHCGNYTPMVEDGMANQFYICIGSHEENGGVVYDCISTRLEQLKIAEPEMKAYLKIGVVSAGVKEIDGKLAVADLEFKKQKNAEPKVLPKEVEKAVVPEISKEAEKPAVKPEEPKVIGEPKPIVAVEVKPVPKEEPKLTAKAEEKPVVKEDKKEEIAKPTAKVETKPVAKAVTVAKK